MKSPQLADILDGMSVVAEHHVPVDREQAIERLAERLYWKMEQLDPGLADVPEWPDLPEKDRRFYRLCVSDLLGFEALIMAARAGQVPVYGGVEVTPEMIEAGRRAYYEIDRYPGDAAVDDETLAAVFCAMFRARKPA